MTARTLATTFVLAATVCTLASRAAADDLTLPAPVGMSGDPSAALVVAGNSAFLHGDLVTAARDYRSALARKPDFAIASFDLGLVEMHAGRPDLGRADMDRGIRLAQRHGMSTRVIARLRALRAAFAPNRVETT